MTKALPNALPKLYKVTVVEGDIYQNGVRVGYISSGSDVWAHVLVNGKQEFFGRWKYGNGRSNLTTMAKDILSRMTPAEYVAEYNLPTAEPVEIDPTRTKSPAEIQAQVLGYPNTMAFITAQNEAKRARREAKRTASFVYRW